jgi:hypothetical protein
MAASVLSNALLLFDGQDLSGRVNTIALDYGAEALDETTLADDSRVNKGGLKTVGLSAEGFWDSTPDSALFTAVGVSGSLISVAPGRSVGDVAYSLQSLAGEYSPIQGSVGEMAGFTLNASARNSLQRGSLLFHSDSETTTGTGSTSNAGSGSITAILHVFAASGTSPTLDVTVESDDADDFTGLEQTQITFTQATGKTAERLTASSTSDTWWRVNYTIGGTNPDFGFAVVLILE